MIKIGQKLKTLRRINNFTIEKVVSFLSKECNMHFSPTALYKWEENKVEPNIYILMALSKVYRSSVSFILGDSILSLDDLTKKELEVLELYRNNEIFMNIARLSLKFFKN